MRIKTQDSRSMSCQDPGSLRILWNRAVFPALSYVSLDFQLVEKQTSLLFKPLLI